MLTKDYKTKVIPAVQKALKLKNTNMVPKLDKVVINVGIWSYITRKDKDYSVIVDRVVAITWQKPVIINACKSVSNFKLRQWTPNGIKVTLRWKKMLTFLDRLINIALPRVRDFQWLSNKSFDWNGNYSIGIKDSTIFPEIVVEDMTKMHWLQINISTTAKDNEAAKVLLQNVGIPFKK